MSYGVFFFNIFTRNLSPHMSSLQGYCYKLKVHSLKKSGRAWRNIGNITVQSANRTVSFSVFSFLTEIVLRVSWELAWPHQWLTSNDWEKSRLPRCAMNGIPLIIYSGDWSKKKKHKWMNVLFFLVLWMHSLGQEPITDGASLMGSWSGSICFLGPSESRDNLTPA